MCASRGYTACSGFMVQGSGLRAQDSGFEGSGLEGSGLEVSGIEGSGLEVSGIWGSGLGGSGSNPQLGLTLSMAASCTL